MDTKIIFFIARYSRSGVPLAQIRLAKAFLRRGYVIEFVIGYVPDYLEAPIVDGATVINLDIQRTFKLLPSIVSCIKNFQPDVIFTAEDHLNTIVAMAAIAARSKAKISASSRISPYRTYSDKPFSKDWVLKYSNILLRRRLDALVCVSEDMAKDYKAIFGETRHQCIYNMAYDADTLTRISEPVDDLWITDKSTPLIVTAGRLCPGKGYPDLINAINIIRKERPIKLAILGEGDFRPELEALIEKQDLSDSVRLLGFQENPLKFFKQANVFALSSYFEGLPNVLIEAMAAGCTLVSTDCPTGPREVLKDGKYGYLVPMHDPESMANAIKQALENPASPELMKEAIEPFTEESVIRKHQKILKI